MKKKITSASGFFRLRFLIVLFVSLTGLFLLASGDSVTANSFSDLARKVLTHSLPRTRPFGLPIYVARVPAAPFASGAFQGSNGLTQKRGSSPTIELEQAVPGLTQPTT